MVLEVQLHYKIVNLCSGVADRRELISQKVFIKSFFESQFSHKSVDFFFMLVVMKDKLADLCGMEWLVFREEGGLLPPCQSLRTPFLERMPSSLGPLLSIPLQSARDVT